MPVVPCFYKAREGVQTWWGFLSAWNEKWI